MICIDWKTFHRYLSTTNGCGPFTNTRRPGLMQTMNLSQPSGSTLGVLAHLSLSSVGVVALPPWAAAASTACCVHLEKAREGTTLSVMNCIAWQYPSILLPKPSQKV